MSELLKHILLRFALPVGASCVMGLGSAVITGLVFNERMDARVTHLEVQIQKHEKALDRDFARHDQAVTLLSSRTDDQERRLTRLETLMDEVHATLTEIRTDVKSLLREGR